MHFFHRSINQKIWETYVMMIVLIVAIMVTIACWCARIKSCNRHSSGAVPEKMLQESDVEDHGPTMEKFVEYVTMDKPVMFTVEQLCSFTNNYSTRLGSGGFGVVYKGQIPNGVNIAVKILKTCNSNERMEAQFMAEVITIGKTDHLNLVRLLGFCYEHTTAALVYEYMEKGSLDKYLFEEIEVIKWEKLHDIAVGTAKGITCLHEQRITHYDIKPANILLDAKFFPKVADFGLAKLCNPDGTNDSSISEYRGTPGYLAPEFFLRNYPVTHKCDVYSFGMLLFEIVGRRRNVEVSSSCSSIDVLDWFPKQVWDKYEKGELAALIMACGIEEKDKEKAKRMSMVALWCVQDSPEARPPMSAVVKMLENERVEIVPPPKPFHYLYSIGTDAMKSPAYKISCVDASKGMKGAGSLSNKSTRPLPPFPCRNS